MNIRRFLIFLCGALLLCPAFGDEPEMARPGGDVTYVIPITGGIEKALLYVIRRGIRQAEADKAGAIILVIDTPGGQLDATDEIVRLLLRVQIPTYAFVKAQAFSAGAIIAFATDHIYMAPGSVIGAAAPVMLSPLGGVQEMPEAMEEKAVSGVSALVRSAAQYKGHDPQLAEAMVRKEKEFSVGENVISPAGELLTLTNTEAEQFVGEDQKPLLSSGTVKDVDELLRLIGRGDSSVVTLEVTKVERIARVIASLSVLLLAGGLLGLYIEFKTPGFGLPGIIGVICLMIFFWGHHIAGLAGMEDMLIFLVGIALLLVEIFLIPGFGAVGMAGIILIIFGLFSAMMPQMPRFGPFNLISDYLQNSFMVVSGAVVLAGLAGFVFFRHARNTRVFKWVALEKSASRDAGYTASEPVDDLVGLRGTSITQLHPGGAGEFGDRRVDVITGGEFLDAGDPIRIVSARGRRIVVERDETV